MCRRAAAGGAAPATTKAQVVVLIDYDTMADGVRGAGTTLAGEVLSPQTVRKMACDGVRHTGGSPMPIMYGIGSMVARPLC